MGPGCGGFPVCARHFLFVAVAVGGSFLMAGQVLGCLCLLALVVLLAQALPVLVWRWSRLGVCWCGLGLVRCCLCVRLVGRKYVRRRLYLPSELVWRWIGLVAYGVGL